jgi:cytochrome c peroxidase
VVPAELRQPVNKFDDLPVAYHANVNALEVPYSRDPGAAPALNDAEVDDVIAFSRH